MPFEAANCGKALMQCSLYLSYIRQLEDLGQNVFFTSPGEKSMYLCWRNLLLVWVVVYELQNIWIFQGIAQLLTDQRLHDFTPSDPRAKDSSPSSEEASYT